MEKKKIVLVGAYGYTGRIICDLLKSSKTEFTAAGRSKEKIELLKDEFSLEDIHVADIRNTDQATKLIETFDVILNCAGPFTEESAILVNKVANSGSKFYVDITGEIGFVKESFERNNLAAKENQTTIVHGCAFESLVADLGINILAGELDQILSVNTFYYFLHSKPSPGTRITMKLSKFRKLYKIWDGDWKEINDRKDQQTKELDGVTYTAVPYPLPEIAFSHWKYKAEKVMSYLLLPREEAMFIRAVESVPVLIEDELERLRQRKNSGPLPDERKLQLCKILIEVTDKNAQQRTMLLNGSDMYLITAKSVVFSMMRYLNGELNESGVISPSSLFSGLESETLKNLGIEVLVS